LGVRDVLFGGLRDPVAGELLDHVHGGARASPAQLLASGCRADADADAGGGDGSLDAHSNELRSVVAVLEGSAAGAPMGGAAAQLAPFVTGTASSSSSSLPSSYSPPVPFTNAASASSALFSEVLACLAAHSGPATAAAAPWVTDAAGAPSSRGGGASGDCHHHHHHHHQLPGGDWELLVRRLYPRPADSAPLGLQEQSGREEAWRHAHEVAEHAPRVRDALLRWAAASAAQQAAAVQQPPQQQLAGATSHAAAAGAPRVSRARVAALVPWVPPPGDKPPPPITDVAAPHQVTSVDGVTMATLQPPRQLLRVVAARGVAAAWELEADRALLEAAMAS
jgi:hypothetical protein